MRAFTAPLAAYSGGAAKLRPAAQMTRAPRRPSGCTKHGSRRGMESAGRRCPRLSCASCRVRNATLHEQLAAMTEAGILLRDTHRPPATMPDRLCGIRQQATHWKCGLPASPASEVVLVGASHGARYPSWPRARSTDPTVLSMTTRGAATNGHGADVPSPNVLTRPSTRGTSASARCADPSAPGAPTILSTANMRLLMAGATGRSHKDRRVVQCLSHGLLLRSDGERHLGVGEKSLATRIR